MKTPRQLLFERHRAAEPDLDRIRQNMLAGLNPVSLPPSRQMQSAATLRDFVLSLRWHLAGLGAAWLVVLFLHADRPAGAIVNLPPEKIPAPRQLLASVQAYRRQLIELLDRPVPAPSATPPRRSQLRPRSEVA